MTRQPSAAQQERDRIRRRTALRSWALAVVSTAAVATAAVLTIGSAPGWPRVRETFFSLPKAQAALPKVLEGLWLNIRVTLVCAALIALLGLGLALVRTMRGPVFFPLRILAIVYVDLFRGLPVLLVIFLLGFGAPALRLKGLPKEAVFWGAAALVLTYSAYVAEVLRAGIESVPRTQRLAARALGLRAGATMRFVVLPQAVRAVSPALLNDLVSLQKDSGLIAVLGVVDAIRAAQIQTATDFNFTPYVVAGALFVTLTIPLARLTDWHAERALSQGAGR
ncbi:polar amino acid ABC transporter, inner membrane subunit [Segniliparus rotundus DSM 44985]|uniref:Polar amino acid ABC transporter, inner membrane subunit n=1 Tax=Segniliparus rotundus (strain ATCC BAA-972 / CDC 1076 / CIP 108378 / DSM 44985 / JCM 13578) TaxID=640132 RepID=D6Z803_SEGRD|nr:amino acid ABC transporter permease [Segniliparus rotundus]ADG98083.1 polar amino acid ABC transporter, inner membrane subunit [Segniliparus rotundus DSM 44985]